MFTSYGYDRLTYPLPVVNTGRHVRYLLVGNYLEDSSCLIFLLDENILIQKCNLTSSIDWYFG